jgi:hypothetical protein
VKTCSKPAARMPKKLSWTQRLVARTATLSPSAITSSIVHSWVISPKLSNSARKPACPRGRSGGPPP